MQTQGKVDFSAYQQYIAGVSQIGLKPYVVVSAINEFGATVPADLADPSNSNLLRPGLNWNSSEVADRYLAIVAQCSAIGGAAGMFYFGVGQEVERYLAAVPQYQDPFVELTAAAGVVARNFSGLPGLAVGVSFNFDGLKEVHGQPFIEAFFMYADQTPIVYVPLNDDWTVRSPVDIFSDLPAMVNYLPAGWPVVIERAGYPSAYTTQPPADNSSQVLQYEFHNAFFSVVSSAGGEQVFRYIGIDGLVDFPPDFCAQLAKATNEAVAEDFCTKGLYNYDGTPKMAKDAAIDGIDTYTTPNEAA